jgi:hypothetical protein
MKLIDEINITYSFTAKADHAVMAPGMLSSLPKIIHNDDENMSF